MKITIIGGGNIGTLLAGELSYKGHEVTVYTSKPNEWNKEISVLNTNNQVVMSGILTHVTNDIKEAVQSAEMIWITMPAMMFAKVSQMVGAYIHKGQIVAVAPGSGGAEFYFKNIVEKGGVLLGMQRVHSIARLKQYGKSVYMLGRKKELDVAAIPMNQTDACADIINRLLNIPCKALPNYLCVTLTPSNPILHTTRLYSLFKNYSSGIVYHDNILFYEQWDDESSSILIKCDEELQKLCEAIPFPLETVLSLKEYYESPTVEMMTQKISSIEAFKGIYAPMIKIEDGWIPDFNSRYFTTDFPYGLKVIKDIANVFHVQTPNIDRVWDWYCKCDEIHSKAAFSLTCDKDDLIKMYI